MDLVQALWNKLHSCHLTDVALYFASEDFVPIFRSQHYSFLQENK